MCDRNFLLSAENETQDFSLEQYARPKIDSNISDQPGTCKYNAHKIKVSETTDFRSKEYPVPNNYQKAGREETDRMLKIIEPRNSVYINPIMPCEGNICVNCKFLNTIRDK